MPSSHCYSGRPSGISHDDCHVPHLQFYRGRASKATCVTVSRSPIAAVHSIHSQCTNPYLHQGRPMQCTDHCVVWLCQLYCYTHLKAQVRLDVSLMCPCSGILAPVLHDRLGIILKRRWFAYGGRIWDGLNRLRTVWNKFFYDKIVQTVDSVTKKTS
jgi:hypothetical protein